MQIPVSLPNGEKFDFTMQNQWGKNIAISPNGRKIALAISEKVNFDLNLSLRAKVRSVHNNIITLLVLFIMLSGHASFIWVSKYNWIILSLLAIIFGMIQYYVNYRNKKEIN